MLPAYCSSNAALKRQDRLSNVLFFFFPPPPSYMSTVIFSLSCSLLCYYYATESLQARFFIHTSSYDLIHFPEQTFITVLCAEAKVTVKKGMLR